MDKWKNYGHQRSSYNESIAPSPGSTRYGVQYPQQAQETQTPHTQGQSSKSFTYQGTTYGQQTSSTIPASNYSTLQHAPQHGQQYSTFGQTHKSSSAYPQAPVSASYEGQQTYDQQTTAQPREPTYQQYSSSGHAYAASKPHAVTQPYSGAVSGQTPAAGQYSAGSYGGSHQQTPQARSSVYAKVPEPYAGSYLRSGDDREERSQYTHSSLREDAGPDHRHSYGQKPASYAPPSGHHSSQRRSYEGPVSKAVDLPLSSVSGPPGFSSPAPYSSAPQPPVRRSQPSSAALSQPQQQAGYSASRALPQAASKRPAQPPASYYSGARETADTAYDAGPGYRKGFSDGPDAPSRHGPGARGVPAARDVSFQGRGVDRGGRGPGQRAERLDRIERGGRVEKQVPPRAVARDYRTSGDRFTDSKARGSWERSERSSERRVAPREHKDVPRSAVEAQTKLPHKGEVASDRFWLASSKETFRSYVCKVDTICLTETVRDFLSVSKRYPKLYVAPEFSKMVVCWTRDVPQIPFDKAVSFEHVSEDVPQLSAGGVSSELDVSAAQPHAEQAQGQEPSLQQAAGIGIDAGLESLRSSPTVWKVKLLLLSGLDAHVLREMERSWSSGSAAEPSAHLHKLLKFVTVRQDKEPIMAFGGVYNPALDGPSDPASQDHGLVACAKRSAVDHMKLNLSNVSQWHRFIEVHYVRGGNAGLPLQREVSVLFIPAVWEVVPSAEEWSQQWEAYWSHKLALLTQQPASQELPKPEPQAGAEAVETTEKKLEEGAVPETKEVKAEEKPAAPSAEELRLQAKLKDCPPATGLFLTTKKSPTSQLRSMSISLDGLLDYDDEDRDEGTFELSLFAESFREYLQFFFGKRILDSLTSLKAASRWEPAERKRPAELSADREQRKKSKFSDSALTDTDTQAVSDSAAAGAAEDRQNDSGVAGGAIALPVEKSEAAGGGGTEVRDAEAMEEGDGTAADIAAMEETGNADAVAGSEAVAEEVATVPNGEAGVPHGGSAPVEASLSAEAVPDEQAGAVEGVVVSQAEEDQAAMEEEAVAATEEAGELVLAEAVGGEAASLAVVEEIKEEASGKQVEAEGGEIAGENGLVHGSEGVGAIAEEVVEGGSTLLPINSEDAKLSAGAEAGMEEEAVEHPVSGQGDLALDTEPLQVEPLPLAAQAAEETLDSNGTVPDALPAAAVSEPASVAGEKGAHEELVAAIDHATPVTAAAAAAAEPAAVSSEPPVKAASGENGSSLAVMTEAPQEEPKKEEVKREGSGKVVDMEVLLAYRYLDRNWVNYIKADDMRHLLHSLGLCLTAKQVRDLVDFALSKAGNARDLVHYKNLVERKAS